MLAEDNRTNQMVAITMLENLGCSVTPAGNGKEALEMVMNQDFDLIFMDCLMPEMDGFEATGNIRKYEEDNNIKKNIIIALTANAMKGDKEKCLESGMDDYLSKPIKAEIIGESLLKWLPQKAIDN